MNEEQAVLDFFAQAQNLPLGLAVAEQVDSIREQMNTRLWGELQQRINTLLADEANPPHSGSWHIELTEDRNVAGSVIGLYCNPTVEQPLYMSPMLEQQYLGNEWRIYFGLMWNASPAPEQLAMPAVAALKNALQQSGFKSNESFLAWKWTSYRPRGSSCLLRYAQQPEKLLDEMVAIFGELLIERQTQIAQANAALRSAPRSMVISLDKLRSRHSD
jgi:hypothetical protein